MVREPMHRPKEPAAGSRRSILPGRTTVTRLHELSGRGLVPAVLNCGVLLASLVGAHAAPHDCASNITQIETGELHTCVIQVIARPYDPRNLALRGTVPVRGSPVSCRLQSTLREGAILPGTGFSHPDLIPNHITGYWRGPVLGRQRSGPARARRSIKPRRRLRTAR